MTDNEIALALVAIARSQQPNVSLTNGKLSFRSGTNSVSFDVYRPSVLVSQTMFFR